MEMLDYITRSCRYTRDQVYTYIVEGWYTSEWQTLKSLVATSYFVQYYVHSVFCGDYNKVLWDTETCPIFEDYLSLLLSPLNLSNVCIDYSLCIALSWQFNHLPEPDTWQRLSVLAIWHLSLIVSSPNLCDSHLWGVAVVRDKVLLCDEKHLLFIPKI